VSHRRSSVESVAQTGADLKLAGIGAVALLHIQHVSGLRSGQANGLL